MFGISPVAPSAAVVFVAVVPLVARASPVVLTAAEVRELVTRPDCGGVSDATPEGVALREHLVAKVTHESGRNPYAIRIESENRAVMTIGTEAGAVREAMWRLEVGQTLGLGLGQNTHKRNLVADFGVADWRDAVPLAFRPCPAIRAMVKHYAGNVDQAARVLDCASGAYWSGKAICGTGYARSVAAIRAALPADSFPSAPRRAQGTAPGASSPQFRPPSSPFAKRAAGRSFTYGNQVPKD